MKRIGALLGLLLVWNAGASVVRAGVIYDNLASTTFSTDTGWIVCGAEGGFGFEQSISESFVAASTGVLDHLLIAMVYASGDTNQYTLTLTDISGTVLEEWGDQAGFFGPSWPFECEAMRINSLLHPQLTAGETYTLTAVADLRTALTFEMGVATTLHEETGAYRVIGTPEPASGLLLALGCVALCLISRHPLRSVRRHAEGCS